MFTKKQLHVPSSQQHSPFSDTISHFTFVDFFPIEETAKEHVGLNVITMKEYLETKGSLIQTVINAAPFF